MDGLDPYKCSLIHTMSQKVETDGDNVVET